MWGEGGLGGSLRHGVEASSHNFLECSLIVWEGRKASKASNGRQVYLRYS